LVIKSNKNHPKADTNVSVLGRTSLWFSEGFQYWRFCQIKHVATFVSPTTSSL